MRMFVAIDLDACIKERLPSVARSKKEGTAFTFVRPEQAHLTLAFLGDVAAPHVRLPQSFDLDDGQPAHDRFGR